MQHRNRGSRQGNVKSRDRTRTTRRNKIRRAITRQTSPSTSARRQTVESVGKLDRESALQAVHDMGITVDGKGKVDTVTARKVAEGAAISAAQALGINIQKADGSIDTAKAKAAVSQVLGFSVEREGAIAQTEAGVRSQQAAAEAAESILKTANALNINTDSLAGNLQDADGNINSAQAVRIAEIALNLKVAKQRQLGRREALDALNISLEAATTQNPQNPQNLQSRRFASQQLEKLQSASVLAGGKIDRRLALDALAKRTIGP